MDRRTDRKALRAQALASLDEARRDLAAHAAQVRTGLEPRALVAQGLAKYRLWIAGASLVAGFAAVRFLFPSRPRVDKAAKPATDRTLSGMVLTGLWSLARPGVLNFMKGRLQDVVMNRFGFTNTHPKD